MEVGEIIRNRGEKGRVYVDRWTEVGEGEFQLVEQRVGEV